MFRDCVLDVARTRDLHVREPLRVVQKRLILALVGLLASLLVTESHAQPYSTSTDQTKRPVGLKGKDLLYVGYDGEIVAPAGNYLPLLFKSMVALDTSEGQFYLKSLDDNLGNPILARVLPSGSLDRGTTAFHGRSLTGLPSEWPKSGETKDPALPAPGTILTTKKRIEPAAVVQGKRVSQWVILGLDPTVIIVPTPDVAVPEDVLWVVPFGSDDDIGRGFDLVWSGPSRTGMFLSVDAERNITFGETGQSIVKPEVQVYWTLLFEKNQSLALPNTGTANRYLTEDLKMKAYVYANGNRPPDIVPR